MYPINLFAFCLMALVFGLAITRWLSKTHDWRGHASPLFGTTYRPWNERRRVANYVIAVPASIFVGSLIYQLATPNFVPMLVLLPLTLATLIFWKAGGKLVDGAQSVLSFVIMLVACIAIATVMTWMIYGTAVVLLLWRGMEFYDVVLYGQLIVFCLYSLGASLVIGVLTIVKFRRQQLRTANTI